MTIDRVAFTVFGKDIYWYGVVIACAVLLGALAAGMRERRAGLPKDTAVDFALLCMPIALVFARLYYVAFEWDSYKNDLLRVFDVRSGGLAIYGGIIGGALAAVILAKRKKIRYGALADLVAPSLALGQAIGRWGNFFNQEAYGAAVANPRFQFFPIAVYIDALSEWHLATFFYESAWCFLIWILLETLIARGAFRGRRAGDVFFWYALMYAAERAVVEGLRTDSLYWGGVRVSQALSCVALIAIAVWFLARGRAADGLKSVLNGVQEAGSSGRKRRGAREWAFFSLSMAAAGGALLCALGVFQGDTRLMIALCAVSLVSIFALYAAITPKGGEV